MPRPLKRVGQARPGIGLLRLVPLNGTSGVQKHPKEQSDLEAQDKHQDHSGGKRPDFRSGPSGVQPSIGYLNERDHTSAPAE
jgi:hypothetical protein